MSDTVPSLNVMTVAEPVFFIVRPVTVAAAGVVAPIVTPSIEPAVRVRVSATSSSAQSKPSVPEFTRSPLGTLVSSLM